MKREVAKYLIAILVMIALFEALKMFAGTSIPLAIVEGASMLPTLHNGDIVLLVGVKPSDLKEGDVIVYKRGDKYIIHRIVDIEIKDGKYLFTTQGDNNSAPDYPQVSEDQVVGRVVCILIPRAGILLQEPFKYIIISMLIIILIALTIKPSRKKEEEGKGEESGCDELKEKLNG